MLKSMIGLFVAAACFLFVGCEKAEKLHIAILDKSGLTDEYPTIEPGIGSVSGFIENDMVFRNLDPAIARVGYVALGNGCRITADVKWFGHYSAKLEPVLMSCLNGRLMYDIGGKGKVQGSDFVSFDNNSLISSAYVDLRFYETTKTKFTFQINDHKVIDQFYGKVKELGDNFFDSYVGSYSTTGSCAPVDISKHEVVGIIRYSDGSDRVCHVFKRDKYNQTNGFLKLLSSGFPKKNGELYQKFQSRQITVM